MRGWDDEMLTRVNWLHVRYQNVRFWFSAASHRQEKCEIKTVDREPFTKSGSAHRAKAATKVTSLLGDI